MTWSWWVLLCVPVAWLVQNCLHELSHLLVGLFQGLKPSGYYPYPHKHEGRFYFSRYSFDYSSLKPYQLDGFIRPHNPRHIAPFFAGMLWSGVFVGLMFLVPVTYRIFLLPFAVFGLIDALWFWRGFFWGGEFCDGKRWRYGG